ncbi:MAG: hypothetical protein M9899_06645 [Bdellovibrionaceae bacterium]|nr:hypothetical protein [Pseudobdellovibrionaceae bacterium]
MKFFTTLAFALSTMTGFFITSAQANETKSEFFYQAGADESFIQGSIRHHAVELESITGESVSIKDLNIKLAYEIGLSDSLAAYGNIGYGDLDFAGILTAKGLDPFNFGVKYQMQAGVGQFFARANLGVGLLGKLDCDNECNRTDGSINLALRAGYLWTLENAFVGLALDYGLFSTDGKLKGSNDDINKKGSAIISAFYERIVADMIFGGQISYSHSGIGGTNSDTPLAGFFYGDDVNGSTDFLGLTFYTRVPMATGFSLLGSIAYERILDTDGVGIDSGYVFGLNIGGRYNF